MKATREHRTIDCSQSPTSAMHSTSLNKINDRPVYWIIGIFSVVVFALVAVLGRLRSTRSWIGSNNCRRSIRSSTALAFPLVGLPLVYPKACIPMHRQLNLLASALWSFSNFLRDLPLLPNWKKRFQPMIHGGPYLIILTTHILLAAIVLPLVLLSLYRGLTNPVDRHRKIVRWSYPVWLYVTFTGVIVYLMIAPIIVSEP